MKNNVAMMQPTFLPWQGYFELIAHSDTFLFLDDFQYCERSFHSRNHIFVHQNKTGLMIVPLNKKKSFRPPLNEVEMLITDFWKNKIYRTLKSCYGKSLYYKEIEEKIIPFILQDHTNLAEYNISIIKQICSLLGINTETKFKRSSEYAIHSQRSARIYDLLNVVQATTYLSAHGSFEYMLEDKVFPCEIPVLFQNYIPQPYPQKHSKEFVPYLSILDALFNVGSEKTLALIKTGTQTWLTWEMMCNNSQ